MYSDLAFALLILRSKEFNMSPLGVLHGFPSLTKTGTATRRGELWKKWGSSLGWYFNCYPTIPVDQIKRLAGTYHVWIRGLLGHGFLFCLPFILVSMVLKPNFDLKGKQTLSLHFSKSLLRPIICWFISLRRIIYAILLKQLMRDVKKREIKELLYLYGKASEATGAWGNFCGLIINQQVFFRQNEIVWDRRIGNLHNSTNTYGQSWMLVYCPSVSMLIRFVPNVPFGRWY